MCAHTIATTTATVVASTPHPHPHPLSSRTQVYRSMWDAARGIVSQRGVQGLYGGLGVTLVEIIPYAALQFGLYDALNALVNEARQAHAEQQRRQAEEAAAAAAYGAEAGEQRPSSGRGGRLHGGAGGAGGSSRSGRAAGMASTSGRGGGDVDSNDTVAPTPAPSAKSQETRLQHFACGLLAGLVAKLVSHPLDVAKKRYQVAGLQRSLR